MRYECEETVNGFSVYMARWDNSPVPSITIRYSTNSGSNYTDIETITGAWFTADKAYNKYTYSFVTPISPTSGNKIYIELNKTTGERLLVDDFELIYGSAAPVPTISVMPASLSDFTYVYDNGPSTEKTFTVSGSNLTANISISAPTNYEISTGTGGSFTATSPITLTQSGGNVASTTIYARLKTDLAIGDYDSETITASSSGATSQTVTCSGTVTSPPPPNAPVATAASNIDDDTFTANWNSVSGATGYKLDVYKLEAGGNASDLFISEYIEGSSNNKAIEIYNGTGQSVNLNGYFLKQHNGGNASTSNVVDLTGYSINHNDVFVVANTSSNSTILGLADLTSNNLNHNGNDAVGLYYGDTLVDIFGLIGTSSDYAKDVTLVRKADASVPKTTYSSDDWDSYTTDYTDNLGSHNFSGGLTKTYVIGYENLSVSGTSQSVTGLTQNTTYYYVVRALNDYGTSNDSNEIEVTTTTSSPVITLSTDHLSDFYYVLGHGPSATQTFTVSGENLTANISIAAPTNYEISLTSDSGYTSPLTLAQSGGTVATTTVYVRLKAGLSTNDYNGELITASSTGAAQKTVTLSGSVTPPPPPALSLSAETLSEFRYYLGGGPSEEQSFTVSGENLVANISISATTNFEISTESGDNFEATNPITLVQSEGSVTTTTIYVHLKAGLEIGDYQNESIAISSSGADAKSVVCNGYVSSPPPPGYFVDFEGTLETKSDYKSGTVTLSGLDWDMTEALIGDLANDWRYESKSARMHGYAASAMTMLEDVVDGVGTVTFSYRRYGTDSQVDWKVEYSTDQGTNWTQLGEDFTALATNDVQIFSEALNVSDNVRIRIKRATESGGSNARLNIDNILLSPYFNIPEDEVVTIGGADFLIDGGSANVDPEGVVPSFINPTLIPSLSIVLTLVGDGPWNFIIETDALFGAYFRGLAWTTVENVDGLIEFNVTAAKDMNLPIILGDADPNTLPVELSTFTVNLNAANNAVLTWVTQSETGVSGFYVFRNISPDLGNASLISALVPATNTSQLHTYVHTDSEVPGPGTYYYWLQAVDIDGSDSFYGPLPLIYSGQPDVNPSAPQVTELKGIYPNPFNPSATLSYALASKAEVRLQIFNSRGQLVRSLNEGSKNPGSYSLIWDGTDDGAQSQSTGVYFFRLQVGDKVFNSKAVLLK